MFTGIIEEVGTVKSIEKNHRSLLLKISAKKVISDLSIGDSIAVNGICLTATSFNHNSFSVDVMNESIVSTSLSTLKNGNLVNLERAMPANGRFGGHIVSGHIDGTGEIISTSKCGIATIYTIKTSPEILKYIIKKGSIAIDGISLTVLNVSKDNFEVSIIPHTSKNTILNFKKVGDVVNLENDLIGKYVEKLFLRSDDNSSITRDFLYKHGY